MNPRSQKVKDRLWVQWKGRLYGMASSLKQAQHAANSLEAQELIAPFSCKVLRIHVAAGQVMKKGDPVVVVEAMKMEYAYASPRDGTIASVFAKEGEILQGGSQFVAWKE